MGFKIDKRPTRGAPASNYIMEKCKAIVEVTEVKYFKSQKNSKEWPFVVNFKLTEILADGEGLDTDTVYTFFAESTNQWAEIDIIAFCAACVDSDAYDESVNVGEELHTKWREALGVDLGEDLEDLLTIIGDEKQPCAGAKLCLESYKKKNGYYKLLWTPYTE